MAYVVQIDLAHEASGAVDHGEDVVLGVGHLARNLTQRVVGAKHLVVVLDDRVHRHEREDGFVGVVRH